MDEEIEFGEVEQAALRRALRPDRNRHYAVVACGEPQDGDLPIFVDLDVLAEMEAHALWDTSVELGGVLLGGHYEDNEGRPFVVVADSLRAEHFESTRGSFKFTHDTWSAITRERNRFPEEMQMVGWYHTHPGWGVFLSGMDMFICDNFFNKRLDVAYVIDPCGGDRGMFQWTEDGTHRVRRTGGFYVTASRFRAAELEYYVAEIQGAMPAAMTTRSAAGATPAPVVHLHQPQGAQPPWLGHAVAGVLALQFLLLALIAWKTFVPPTASAIHEDKIVAALEKLDERLESERQTTLAQERTKAQAQMLDEVARELKGTDEGFITRLAERFDQTSKLTEDIAARDARIRELTALVEDHRSRLQALERKSKADEERLKGQIASLTMKNERLMDDLDKNRDELASLRSKQTPLAAVSTAASKPEGNRRNVLWWVAGAALAGAAIVAGVLWIGRRQTEELKDERTESKS